MTATAVDDRLDAAIAIVGIGALFPGARSAAEFWQNIIDGVDAITEVPPDRWDEVFYDPEAETPDRVYCRRGGFVDSTAVFDPTEFGIMPVTVEAAEPDQLLALQVASDAIADTVGGLPAADRVGVVVGRGGYLTPGMVRLDQRIRIAEQLAQTLHDLAPELGADRVQEVKAAFQAQLGPMRPEGAIDLVPNLTASRIANRLDLQGPAFTLDAACASSLIAVDLACKDLRSGRADAVIAGGVHHCHDVGFWAVFSMLRALSPSQQIRPFDRSADGLLIGEGTGMVVLKRLADAERDGDRVYALVRGTGTASDGRGSSVMVPRVEGQQLALERAWAESGLDPAGLGLVEAHGTATQVGDEAELTTLGRFFGGPDAGPPVGLGSVKSMIGHAMPAAGMAGLIKAALALHHRVLPPTLHCDDPHPAFATTRFRPLTEVEPWEEAGPSGVRTAGINAFGFGGINAHVVLTEAPNPVLATPHRPLPDVRSPDQGDRGDRVVLIAGSQPQDLLDQLDDPTILTTRTDTVAPAGAMRLAIVDPNEKRVTLARKVVERGTPWRGRNDVWFHPQGSLGPARAAESGGATGKVAFLFPGVEPTFSPRSDDVAQHFGLDPVAIDEGGGLGHHGAGIIALGRLLHGALEASGVTPDVVAGHSIGEWNAMIAGGLVSEHGLDAFIADVDLDAIEVPDVQFLALGCGAETAAQVIDGVEGVHLSHDNCPHQSVVCGPEEAIAQVMARLSEHRVLGQVLPFRSGFHTPSVLPFLAPAERDVQRVPLSQAALPVWSATTVAPYPTTAEEVRELVIRHLVEPVRFRELAERLHEQGVTAFVQVGVGSLTAFLDDTLKDRDVLTVAAGSEDRAGLDQLRRAAAALWVEGAEPRFEVLVTGGPEQLAVAPAPPSGTRVDVPLGAPLVRLDGPRLDVGGAGDLGGGLDELDGPVLGELGAALREAAAAGRAVAAAWSDGPAGPTATPVPLPTPDEPAESAERVDHLRLTIENMPHLIDHAFYRQAPGWPELSDRFPLVPMTGMLELLREAAVRLVPGRLPVAVEDIRALRWLAVEPPADVTITSRRVEGDPHRVRVTIEGHCRGTVVLADAWPDPPPPDTSPLGEVAVQGPTADDLYEQHWLFHGPQFQGIRAVGPMGPGGMTARIECLPAPGAILDAAGQLVGHWIAVLGDRDQLALPRHLDAVRWYGPTPEPGTPLDVTMRMIEVTDESLAGDLELVDVDGRLWCRIDAWEDHRFQTDDVTWPVATAPEHRASTEAQDGGWVLVRERWGNTASRELSMRRYLTRTEREVYEAMNPNAQRQWLLGRIAAKDAVRLRLWAEGAGAIFPAEVVVGNEDSGQPTVGGVTPPGWHVSLAHTEWIAVALVGDEPVGIDVERVEPRTERFDSLVMSDDELALLPTERDEDEWRARVWTAKEAAAKAAGTGLQGNPRRFVLEAVDGDRLRIADRWVTTRVLVLDPDEPDVRHVVGWTGSAAEGENQEQER